MDGKVWFIGAGPGDPELITVKGARLIAQADLVLYAGSLVPREVVAGARPGARVEDSSSLTLEETHALLVETARAGGLAARVHTGDPSLYGAIHEQTALLDRDGVPWEIVPGVTAAFAAAAAAGASFTVPGGSQSLIITRTGKNTGMPAAQGLRGFAAHGCALALYLAAGDAANAQEELLAGGLPGGARVVLGHKLGWPGGSVQETTLDRLAATTQAAGVARQAVYLVLPDAPGQEARSRLYDPAHGHMYRRAG